MKKMLEKFKESKSSLALIILALVLIIAGISFALINPSINLLGRRNIKINKCELDLNFKESDELMLISKYPIKDSEVSKYKGKDITITNNSTCDTAYYKLTIKDLNSSSINKSKIKFQLVDKTSRDTTSGSDPDTFLVNDSLTKGDSKSYEIKLWIDESATNADLYENGDTTKPIEYKYALNLESGDEELHGPNLDSSGANEPQLASNMIPVYFDESGNVYKADKFNAKEDYKWYDYDQKMWANAVTVDENVRDDIIDAEEGTEISMSDINAMFVWIPRYKYEIFSSATPQEINITFENGTNSTGTVTCNEPFTKNDLITQEGNDKEFGATSKEMAQEKYTCYSDYDIDSKTGKMTLKNPVTRDLTSYEGCYFDGTSPSSSYPFKVNSLNKIVTYWTTSTIYENNAVKESSTVGMNPDAKYYYSKNYTYDSTTKKYTLTNPVLMSVDSKIVGYYTLKSTTANSTSTTMYKIDSFDDKNNARLSYNVTYYTMPTEKCSSNTGEYTHPAFTFDNKQLTGLWIGKFSNGFSDKDDMHITPDNAITPISTYSEAHEATRKMELAYNKFGFEQSEDADDYNTLDTYDSNKLDTHTMKNMEWGAVAYLSHSKYGTCTDGECIPVEPEVIDSSCSGTRIHCGDYSTITETTTTQNIYGVYDMVRDTNNVSDLVPLFYKNITDNQGSAKNIVMDSKYYDAYSSSFCLGNDSSDECIFSGGRLGDGTNEMLPSKRKTWYYGGFDPIPYSGYARGGGAPFGNGYEGASLFSLTPVTNNGLDDYWTFRVSLVIWK